MRDFYNWLKKDFPGGVVLVGHGFSINKSNFRLAREFYNASYSFDELNSIINGFQDTLKPFQEFFGGIPLTAQLTFFMVFKPFPLKL